MIDKSNYLFTQIKNLYTITQLKGSGQTPEEPSPTSLPYMFFNVIGNEQTADDLSNTENAVNMTIEITFYASGTGKLNTCKNLMGLASDKMQTLGFRRIFGPSQIINMADASICRFVARFNRVIGTDDIL